MDKLLTAIGLKDADTVVDFGFVIIMMMTINVIALMAISLLK